MEKQHHPVHTREVKEVLRGWLEEVDVKCACAVGIKNTTKGRTLENPRMFIVGGGMAHEPTGTVEPDMASVSLFTKTQYSLTGTSGCLCYDISGTDMMVSALWSVPFSETLSENHFNVRCLHRDLCNDMLFKLLWADSKTPNEEVVREENGFRVCACMGREDKAILIVDCFESSLPGVLVIADPVRSGPELERRLREMLEECDVKTACGVGINNLSGHQLISPRVYIDSGRSVVAPPSVTDNQMAAPSLFSKRKYSLKGSSGCMTFEIKTGKDPKEFPVLAVLWSVPLSETLSDNRFFATVIPKVDCDRELYKRLWGESRPAKDGEVVKEERGFQVTSRMEPSSHALFITDIRPKRV